MSCTDPETVAWGPLPEMWSCPQRARAVAGPQGEYELLAYVLPRSTGDEAQGPAWEVFGGPDHMTQLAAGMADTFEDAKAQAIAAWQRIMQERGA